MDLNQRVNRVSDHSKSCIQDIRTAWNHRDDPGLMLRCYSNKMSSFRALFTLWDLPGSQASLLLLHLRQSHEPQHSEQIQNRFRTDSEQKQPEQNWTGEPGFPSGFLQRDGHDFRTVRHLVAWKWRYPSLWHPQIVHKWGNHARWCGQQTRRNRRDGVYNHKQPMFHFSIYPYIHINQY